ncbi:type II toxin-antitoxin system RelB/DinJ family antitoxin [Enterococcus sp. DIV0756]|uniref:type II toxin-antitoxin system RelB/DinJ family antitoxin n=1 Tax=Enterococcus sp. DIV0756 TaxID=2774636 RepID=UPI003F1F27E4
MELKDKKTKKKKIQVNIDKELSQDVDLVLDSLGLNPTVLITALYKRVAAQGEIPFSLALTDREKAINRLSKAADNVPTKQLDNIDERTKWLDEDDE